MTPDAPALAMSNGVGIALSALPPDEEQRGDRHANERRAREVEHLRRSCADLAQPLDGAHRRLPARRRGIGESPRVVGFSRST